MAKPIKMTKEAIEAAVSEFRKSLEKLKTADGTVNYKADLKLSAERKAILNISATAWLKMKYLVDVYDTEIGWFGLCARDTEQENTYNLLDIIVYPQTVTGSTVDTDEKKLGTWYESLPDEVFFLKNFHGHSHVKFAPNPSTTDIKDREEKLKDMPDDGFFVFMILNKDEKLTCEIYDAAQNVHYENKDVIVCVTSSAVDFFNSLALVEEKSYSLQKSATIDSIKAAKKGSGKLDKYYGNYYNNYYGGMYDEFD